jgi:hypothetical protein
LSLWERRFDLVLHVRSFEQVSRMAILAGDAVELVLRSVKQGLIVAGDVTVQASCRVIGRLGAKAEDPSPGYSQLLIVSAGSFNSFDVRLAWPMTTFAPGAVLHVR